MKQGIGSGGRIGPVDFSRRADLDEFAELMDQPSSREDMRACLRDLARVNRWFLGYRPTLEWLEGLRRDGRLSGQGPVRILDVGCGYGDGLRRIAQWARRRGVAVELIGLDLNPDIVAIAEEATPAGSGIRWVAGDVFAYPSADRVDVVVSALFAHHLRDGDVVRFVRWMEEHARLGWFINDLSRAAVPYHLFGWFARVMGLHRFVQHDGPVSFARAFQAADWRRLCGESGIAESQYQILPYKPARLCVGRMR